MEGIARDGKETNGEDFSSGNYRQTNGWRVVYIERWTDRERVIQGAKTECRVKYEKWRE